MKSRLLGREVLPFLAAFIALVAAALLLDAFLHLLGAVWVGRYLGIPGILLVIASFGYSLRKRQLIKIGKPLVLLRVHERMAWFGSLLVLIHAGVHFTAILAWLATIAMLVNVGSGLTGKFLLQRGRKQLEESRQDFREQGLSAAEIDDLMYWDILTYTAITNWRVVHRPIALVFAVLASAHILSIFLFWAWR
ncbi:hypothetical protein V5279_43675 [Bradyrhizobium sp. 26S5]|uniref:hypothetical protein n=1 Tax=Bradyrhizobium sp. 26S5 TaxID=3139729 RepID=UPI0030CB3E10